MFNDWQTAKFSVETAVDSTFATTGKAKPVVNYVTPGKVLTIDLTKDETYGFGVNSEGKSGVWMVCPEEPAFGTTLVFSYPQDSFQDIWGNPTKEVDLATLCAYDYVLEDIFGSYAGGALVADLRIGEWVPGSTSMKLEKSDDEKKGNVKITELHGFPCEEVYAKFNPQSATLTVPDWQFMMTHPTAGDLYFGLNTSDPDMSTVFTMPEKGVLEGPDVAYGVYLNAENGGWVALIGAVELTVADDEEGDSGETTALSLPDSVFPAVSK